MSAERIDHAAEARKHIDWAHAQQGNDGEFDYSVRDNALIAQAEATLALVEQQRIANVLTYIHGHYESVSELHKVYEDIRKGLGL